MTDCCVLLGVWLVLFGIILFALWIEYNFRKWNKDRKKHYLKLKNGTYYYETGDRTIGR